ncbi:MAG TPA: GNAT family N-acetyltransferase [Sphaerochaeta sp.]|jgi:GNAT superfamily N-acetyltransferase|nr:GNAT family N-acetyltransferase [Sphaerochaeta sp.]
MTIRAIPTPDDRASIECILTESGFFNSEEVEIGVSLLDEYFRTGEASGYSFLFAEEDERVVGYTCYGPIPGTLVSWDLYWIAVAVDRQGTGIGRQLLSLTEARIKGMGGKRVYVETSSRPLYEPTRRFYERAGYKEEARLAEYYAPDDDKVLCVKWWE